MGNEDGNNIKEKFNYKIATKLKVVTKCHNNNFHLKYCFAYSKIFDVH